MRELKPNNRRQRRAVESCLRKKGGPVLVSKTIVAEGIELAAVTEPNDDGKAHCLRLLVNGGKLRVELYMTEAELAAIVAAMLASRVGGLPGDDQSSGPGGHSEVWIATPRT